MNLSVFLTASGGLDQELRDLVGDWTVAGLLQPSIWTAVSDWHTGEHGVPAPLCHRLEPSRDQDIVDLVGDPVDLSEAIGGAVYDTVRLVVVTLLPTADVDENLPDVARQLGDHLRRSLAPADARLVKLNLLVPASGVEGVSLRSLQPGWDANIVASPEDHFSQRHGNVMVRKDSNFLGHAALHCATIGGLWRGSSVGPFDAGGASSAGQDPDPVLVRCFARVARGSQIMDDLARMTLAARDRWPLPVGASPPAVPCTNPGPVVTSILFECKDLADGALLFHPFPGIAGPERRTIGLRATMRLFFARAVARMRGIPTQLVEWTEPAKEEGATRLVQATTGLGPDSALVPTFGAGRAPPVARRLRSPFVKALAADAGTILEAVGPLDDQPLPSVPAVPEVWSQLLAVALGLVDGGDIPPPFTAPVSGGRRQIIADPALIAPDPADEEPLAEVDAHIPDLATGSGTRLRPCDPRGARLVREWLEEQEARQVEPAEEETTSEEQSADEQAREALDRLRRWQQAHAHGDSLLWQLGDLLGRQLDKALGAFREAMDRLAEGAPDLRAAGGDPGRRLRRRLLVTALLAVVLLAAALVLHATGDVGSLGLAGLLTLILVGTFGAAAATYLWYCRDMFALEHRLRSSCSAFDEAFEAAYRATWEVHRLSSLYEQYLDWAEIIGWIVHHPWAPAEAESVDKRPHLDAARLPRAFRSAAGEVPVAQRDRLTAQFSESLFTSGWLTRTYLAVVHGTGVLHRGALPDDADLRAEFDAPDVPSGARAVLLERFQSGRAPRERRTQALHELARFCRERDPSEVLGEIRPEGGETQPSGVVEYLTETLCDPDTTILDRSILRSPQGNEVDAVDVWVPKTYLDRADLLPRGAKAFESDVQVEQGRSYLVELITMERTRPVRPSDLSLFAPAEVPTPTRTRRVGPDEIV